MPALVTKTEGEAYRLLNHVSVLETEKWLEKKIFLMGVDEDGSECKGLS